MIRINKELTISNIILLISLTLSAIVFLVQRYTAFNNAIEIQKEMNVSIATLIKEKDEIEKSLHAIRGEVYNLEVKINDNKKQILLSEEDIKNNKEAIKDNKHKIESMGIKRNTK